MTDRITGFFARRLLIEISKNGFTKSSTRSIKAVQAGLVILAVFVALPVFANTITVTNTLDSGPGSLRDAIATAAPGDTINFSVTGTITLTSGELLINQNLTITGPGASGLAISGNFLSRVFDIGSGTVAVSGLTIQNGSTSADPGGGIYNHGTLTLSNNTLSNNSAAIGGGIYNNGTLTVTNSTLSGNVSSDGGGIYNLRHADREQQHPLRQLPQRNNPPTTAAASSTTRHADLHQQHPLRQFCRRYGGGILNIAAAC